MSSPSHTSLPRTLREITLAHPGQVTLATILVIILTGYASYVSAQPVPTEIPAAALEDAIGGSPWAMVLVVLVMASGQLASALKEWSKARKVEGEELRRRVTELETRFLEEKAIRHRVEAERDLARARLGDVSSDRWPEVGEE